MRYRSKAFHREAEKSRRQQLRPSKLFVLWKRIVRAGTASGASNVYLETMNR